MASQLLAHIRSNADQPGSDDAAQYTKQSFTTPRAGRLLVRYENADITRNCTAGFARAAIYLDGAGLPNSGVDVQRTPELDGLPARHVKT
jgi:hypothetical protein